MKRKRDLPLKYPQKHAVMLLDDSESEDEEEVDSFSFVSPPRRSRRKRRRVSYGFPKIFEDLDNIIEEEYKVEIHDDEESTDDFDMGNEELSPSKTDPSPISPEKDKKKSNFSQPSPTSAIPSPSNNDNDFFNDNKKIENFPQNKNNFSKRNAEVTITSEIITIVDKCKNELDSPTETSKLFDHDHDHDHDDDDDDDDEFESIIYIDEKLCLKESNPIIPPEKEENIILPFDMSHYNYPNVMLFKNVTHILTFISFIGKLFGREVITMSTLYMKKKCNVNHVYWNVIYIIEKTCDLWDIRRKLKLLLLYLFKHMYEEYHPLRVVRAYNIAEKNVQNMYDKNIHISHIDEAIFIQLISLVRNHFEDNVKSKNRLMEKIFFQNEHEESYENTIWVQKRAIMEEKKFIQVMLMLISPNEKLSFQFTYHDDIDDKTFNFRRISGRFFRKSQTKKKILSCRELTNVNKLFESYCNKIKVNINECEFTHCGKLIEDHKINGGKLIFDLYWKVNEIKTIDIVVRRVRKCKRLDENTIKYL